MAALPRWMLLRINIQFSRSVCCSLFAYLKLYLPDRLAAKYVAALDFTTALRTALPILSVVYTFLQYHINTGLKIEKQFVLFYLS